MHAKLQMKTYMLRIVAVVAIVLLTVVVTMLVSNRQQSYASKEIGAVKASVGKLMLLPDDEDPTLAIVEDKTQLTDDFLKKHAQKGDQILIYTDNAQAIVYRPSINKIVAVSPVTIDLALAESEGTSISILNGTSDLGIATELKDKIQSRYPNVVITTGKASRANFPNTIIIDNTDQKDNFVDSLMSITMAKRGVVPLGESNGSKTILIIVGKDVLN